MGLIEISKAHIKHEKIMRIELMQKIAFAAQGCNSFEEFFTALRDEIKILMSDLEQWEYEEKRYETT